MSRTIHLSAASRLHFGLLAFGHSEGRQYGGAGVMIKQPRIKLTVTSSDAIHVSGPGSDRVAEFAKKWALSSGMHYPLACSIHVSETVPSHSGFGSGTQLGLAVARSLDSFFRRPTASIQDLAASVRRGGRSAVGSYGFANGGFVAETGRLPNDRLGKLFAQCTLPDDWRVILLQRPNVEGLSGAAERRAFAGELPSIPDKTTETMTNLLISRIVPAAERGDLAGFGSGVHEFGLLAGGCFATLQGGPFASQQAQSLVDWLEGNGVHGVGQSSWGPTLFGFVESHETAQDVIQTLSNQELASGWTMRAVGIENDGAQLTEG